MRIVLLTMHKDAVNVRLALEAKVEGYVLKDDAFEKLATAVAAVARGERQRVMQKLGFHKAAEIVQYAVKMGLVR